MLTPGSRYEEICNAFRWRIPARFNMGVAVCDRHAARAGAEARGADDSGEELPTVLSPLPGAGGTFEVQPSSAGAGEAATLAPWDYAGIYRKDKHLAIGGFDPRISESWWQKLDYGMRAWLWGEEIRVHPALKVLQALRIRLAHLHIAHAGPFQLDLNRRGLSGHTYE